MALVRKFQRIVLERESTHTEVECTYSIVQDAHGNKMLQIDTYGSAEREIPGKKSQSIRFAPEALKVLKKIIREL